MKQKEHISDWAVAQAEIERLETENNELQALFDLQRTRMDKATAAWQQATGNHELLPDLGKLLDWLLTEIERLEAENSDLRDEVNGWARPA